MFFLTLAFSEDLPINNHKSPLQVENILKILLLLLSRPADLYGKSWPPFILVRLIKWISGIPENFSQWCRVAFQKAESPVSSILAPLYWFSNFGWRCSRLNVLRSFGVIYCLLFLLPENPTGPCCSFSCPNISPQIYVNWIYTFFMTNLLMNALPQKSHSAFYLAQKTNLFIL